MSSVIGRVRLLSPRSARRSSPGGAGACYKFLYCIKGRTLPSPPVRWTPANSRAARMTSRARAQPATLVTDGHFGLISAGGGAASVIVSGRTQCTED